MGIPKQHKTKVQIAQILLIIGIVFSIIGLLFSALFVTIFSSPAITDALQQSQEAKGHNITIPTHIFSSVFPSLFSVIAIVSIIGLILSLLSLWFSLKEDLDKAGILALVAAFVPPLALFQLIAGILFLVSRK